MYEQIYDELRRTDRLPEDVPLYSSEVHFTKAALEQKFGREFDISEVEQMLIEEKMLPRNRQALVTQRLNKNAKSKKGKVRASHT